MAKEDHAVWGRGGNPLKVTAHWPFAQDAKFEPRRMLQGLLEGVHQQVYTLPLDKLTAEEKTDTAGRR